MIWGRTSEYTGSNTDIQREKRLNEWQRAMMLSPNQREMVQGRMVDDPYDRDASTRLERINSRVNADPATNARTSSAFREAIANRLYESPQSTSANGSKDNAYSRAQRQAPQNGGAFDARNDVTVGEVNGRRVVAPQAGKYNQYNAFLASMGLGDSPSPEAYSYAVERADVDPNKRYDSNARVQAAQITAQGRRAAEEAKMAMQDRKMQSQERIANSRTRSKQYDGANKALDAVGGEKGYGNYLKSFRSSLKDVKDLAPDEARAYFESQGIPFSEAGGRYVPLPRNKWTPGMSSENPNVVGDAMNAAQATPGGAIAVQQRLQNGMASPAGQTVESIYNRVGMPAPQAAPTSQASNPAQDSVMLQQSMAALMQRGMSPQQARQTILQRAQQLGPAAVQRVQAAMMHGNSMSPQQHGDRILATQVGR